MRYEYIEPFISSAIRVLDRVIQSDISRGKVALVSGEHGGDVSVVIPLSGDAEGSITLNMDNETALRISGVMNCEPFESLTPLAMDSIAELANMIAGNSTSALNSLGHDFVVSPPAVLRREAAGRRMQSRETFQVPLFTELGEIIMNISLRTC